MFHSQRSGGAKICYLLWTNAGIKNKKIILDNQA
jgi:hypothetical protein